MVHIIKQIVIFVISSFFLFSYNSYALPTPDASSQQVGKTQADIGVNPAGGFNYSMPIFNLPASGALTPKISLNYSHQAGNGVLGLGWQIAGLSKISRCRQTFEQDGINRGIMLNDKDRFCLDGQRLIQIPNQSGISSAVEYRTEVDQQLRVLSYGAPGDPSHFEVYQPNGRIVKYGQTLNSKLTEPRADTTIEWYINEVRDRSTNYYTVEYHDRQQYGERLVSRVRYSGNRAANTEPTAELEFVYANRPDAYEQYLLGRKINKIKRLTRINVRNIEQSSTVVRYYNMNYHPTSDKSQITAMTECGVKNGQSFCLPPTRFDWTTNEQQITFRNFKNIPDSLINLRLADVSGNGFQDLVWLEFSNNGKIYYQVAPYTGSGYDFSHQPHIIDSRDDDTITLNNFQLFDYNQDGKDDLLVPVPGFTWLVYLSQGSQFSPTLLDTGIGAFHNIKSAQTGDFSGDGLPDLMVMTSLANGGTQPVIYPLQKVSTDSRSQYSFKLNHPSPFFAAQKFHSNTTKFDFETYNNERITFDIDSNGQADILAAVTELTATGAKHAKSWRIFTRNPDSVNRYDELTVLTHFNGVLKDLFVQDLNGDGLQDLLYKNANTNWYFQLYDGNGAFTSPTFLGQLSTELVNNQSTLQLTDFNSDGLTDLMFTHLGTYHYRAWTGKTFGPRISTGIGVNHNINKNDIFFDINGDSLVDMLRLNLTANTYENWLHVNEFTPRRVINRVTDGIGAMTEIEYTALTQGTHYTKENNASSLNWGQGSAVVDYLGPMYVVSHQKEGKNFKGQKSYSNTKEYAYTGYKIQLGGRGSLGFRQVSTHDHVTQERTTTTYRLDFPFTGQTESYLEHYGTGASQEKTRLISTPLSSRQLFPGVHSVISGRTSTFEYKENNVLLKKTIKDKSIDNFGNLQRITETRYDGFGNQNIQITTQNTYNNQVAPWLISQLRRNEVTYSRLGVPNVTKTKTYDYHSSTGKLVREYTQPDGDASTALVRELSYNAYGLVTQESVRPLIATGLAPRGTISTYDRFGRYVVKSQNLRGDLISQALAHNVLGQETLVENNQGVQSQSVYGAFGRTFYNENSLGTNSKILRRDCAIWADCRYPLATSVTQTFNNDGSRLDVYIDHLGQEVGRIEFGDKPIFTRKIYDAAGRIIQESEPYTDHRQALYSHNEYDRFGRLIKLTQADGSVYRYEYDGLFSKITNPKGQTKSELRNVSDEVVQVTDSLNTSTRYIYTANGNLLYIIQNDNETLSFKYDVLDRKTYTHDLNKGAWSYTHNAFGEMTEMFSPLGILTALTYDDLGRVISKVESDHRNKVYRDIETTYIPGRIDDGAIATQHDQISGLEFEYGYDQLGRKVSTTRRIDGFNFVETRTYDYLNRLSTVTDISGAVTGYEYRYGGLLSRTYNVNTNQTYEEILSYDVRGKPSEIKYGNQLVTYKDYDAATGRLTSIITGNGGNIQNIALDYDALGNLLNRTHRIGTLTQSEDFEYDNANRLTRSYLNGHTNFYATYDNSGNILTKSNVENGATYQYGSRPAACGFWQESSSQTNAVTQIGSRSYCYDNAGNVRSDSTGRSYQYTAFDKPSVMSKDGKDYTFDYDFSDELLKQTYEISGETYSQYHVNGTEVFPQLDGSIKYRRNVGQAIISVDTLGNESSMYLHQDHISSADVMTNANGHVMLRYSFDAFGQKRAPTTWAPQSSFVFQLTSRGFTDHKTVSNLNLVHMGGRTYDPEIGRFQQADRFVQDIYNPQSLNRYSYVLNNPLSYKDPTGYLFAKVFKKIAKKIARAFFKILNKIPGGAIIGQFLACSLGGPIGCAIFAFYYTLGATGGDFRAAGISGVVAGFSSFVGGEIGGIDFTSASGTLARLTLSGLSGCAASAAQGGDCGEGAKRGAISQAAAIGLQQFTGGSATAEVAKKDAVIKPAESIRHLFTCGRCDVVETVAANVGKSVRSSDPSLVGKTLSEAAEILKARNPVLEGKSIDQIVEFSSALPGPAQFTDITIRGITESGVLQNTAQYVPGFNSAAVFHDQLVGAIGEGLNLSPTVGNFLFFNLGTIPPAFALNYAAASATRGGFSVLDQESN